MRSPFSFSFPQPKRTWSRDDVRVLRELAQQGLPLTSIAKALGKSESAVRNKATLHGVTVSRQKPAIGGVPQRPGAARSVRSIP